MTVLVEKVTKKIAIAQNEKVKKDVLVCIPAYNAGGSIVETIKSVLSQTYENFDVLVVDNKSTDNTTELVERLKEDLGDGRLHLIVNKENLGRIGNWNECLKIFRETSHKYLKFVFAGDTIQPSCLERLRESFHAYPNIGLAVAGYHVHTAENMMLKKVSFVKSMLFHPRMALWLFFTKGNWVGAPIACMISRKAALSVIFSEKLQWTADWKFYVDVSKNFDVLYIPELLGNFYILQGKYYQRHRLDFFSRLEELRIRFYALYKLASPLYFLKTFPLSFLKWLFLSKNQRYAFMQKVFYEKLAVLSEDGEDSVVGSYNEHNAWEDYDLCLMKYVDASFKEKTGLDFGCGPGRNIIKYHSRFQRLDGVDISEKNIEHARKNLESYNILNTKLFVNNGFDMRDIPSEDYDFIMSTICFQHICVHSTRVNLLRDFFRVLKKKGRISIQMGYGKDSPNSVPYLKDNFNTLTTNRGCDTRVESPEELKKDIEDIGFRNFEYWLRPSGPRDTHPQWIFFTAIK